MFNIKIAWVTVFSFPFITIHEDINFIKNSSQYTKSCVHNISIQLLYINMQHIIIILNIIILY